MAETSERVGRVLCAAFGLSDRAVRKITVEAEVGNVLLVKAEMYSTITDAALAEVKAAIEAHAGDVRAVVERAE